MQKTVEGNALVSVIVLLLTLRLHNSVQLGRWRHWRTEDEFSWCLKSTYIAQHKQLSCVSSSVVAWIHWRVMHHLTFHADNAESHLCFLCLHGHAFGIFESVCKSHGGKTGGTTLSKCYWMSIWKHLVLLIQRGVLTRCCFNSRKDWRLFSSLFQFTWLSANGSNESWTVSVVIHSFEADVLEHVSI